MGGIISFIKILRGHLDEGFDNIADLLNSKADWQLELKLDSAIHNDFHSDDLYLMRGEHYLHSLKAIPYRPIRTTDNGNKLIKYFKGKPLVTELGLVSLPLDELLEFFRKYESSGITISCRGMDYFEMQIARFRNGLYSVGDRISLPSVYHTNDERFNRFREGSILKL